MSSPVGFWSYVHRDDEDVDGRISKLARDLVARYGMITGEDIQLFLDRDSIEWGDEWRARVDESLATVAFFIPVLTPRYFQSVECRRELNHFARKAEELGIKELVMPIHYVDVPGLDQDDIDDPAMALIKRFQWRDWRELAFADTASPEYRREVALMAKRLMEANRAAEQADTTTSAIELIEGGEEDESPGLLDRMAEAEEALPEWNTTLVQLTQEIEALGNMMSEGAADIRRGENQGPGFAARLVVARRIARDLDEPADRIEVLAREFTRQLNAVDSGVRVMIEQVPGEIQEDEGNRAVICEFFASIRGLVAGAESGLGSLQGMIDSMQPLERMSRDLRPHLRKLRQTLTLVTEGRAVMREWVRLMDATGVECPQA
jgi:hypothetical protein